MFRKHYEIDWNKKDDSWDVVIVGMRSEPIFKGLKDAEFAQKIADQLTDAYSLGIEDKDKDFRDKVENIFFRS